MKPSRATYLRINLFDRVSAGKLGFVFEHREKATAFNDVDSVTTLSRQIGRHVVVLICLEMFVAKIAPENRCHPQIVCFLARLSRLDNLAARLSGTKVNGRTNRRERTPG